jgi:hypothetical protein
VRLKCSYTRVRVDPFEVVRDDRNLATRFSKQRVQWSQLSPATHPDCREETLNELGPFPHRLRSQPRGLTSGLTRADQGQPLNIKY